MNRLRRLVGRVARQDGYTLLELLVVLLIFGTVMGGLTSLFVAANKAELDNNRRFQSQQNARLAFDQLRRDIHCSSSATVSSGGATVALTLPSQCTGTPTITWCAVLVSTNRYKLYRNVANPSSCGATDREYADYLTSNVVFTYAAQSTLALAKLTVLVPVNVFPSTNRTSYDLTDSIVLRNSQRT